MAPPLTKGKVSSHSCIRTCRTLFRTVEYALYRVEFKIESEISDEIERWLEITSLLWLGDPSLSKSVTRNQPFPATIVVRRESSPERQQLGEVWMRVEPAEEETKHDAV